MPQGTLFTEDFLNEGIQGTDAWRSITTESLDAFSAAVRTTLSQVADPARLNEAQTEERIVKPILDALGWQGCYWVQERLETKGRANVPDYLFFGTPEDFAKADSKRDSAQRYPLAIAVGDAKAWTVDLDRRGSGVGADETPSAQILRYLSRAETQSDRKVQWGILTNGRYWRLYYQGAKSRLEEYFEVDIAWTFGLAGTQGVLGAAVRPPVFVNDDTWRRHLLTLFRLMFRREAFLPDAGGRTFHQIALAEGREWEARVRQNLADVVFKDVFPDLIRALVRSDPNAAKPVTAEYLAVVREAALTFLYRLLFALYAEDRDLLPKRDPNYGGLSRLRDEVAERIDAGTTLSGRRKGYAHVCAELFATIDQGDDTLGVPPYNGGLFSDRTPATELLDNAALPDADFAPLLDHLARTEKDGRRARINFRDLSVQQLGSIYERLLEYEPIAAPDKPDGIDVRLNPFARKGSGSYYTPDELVKLIVERTIGPLVEEKRIAFHKRSAELASDRRAKEARLEELRQLDPAEAVLGLKVVDPAMGSGHFLVSLVDYLADRVIVLMSEARHEVLWADYVSPLVARLADVWAKIRAEAEKHRWVIRDDQLADKNLIKRFILKRCVYGVDKNPMAVELAKVALWLHTFTAGAPLSFLDHHLKCGDSLYGEWVRKALDELAARGTLMISDAVRSAEASIAGMALVESRSDSDIAEVKQSAEDYHGVEAKTEPLRRFLDFWQAVKWLDLSAEEKKALQALFDGHFGQPLPIAGGLTPPNPPAGGEGDPALFGEAPHQLALAGTGVSSTQDYIALRGLLQRVHTLVSEQRFLHWQIAFPGVWRSWTSNAPDGGFDAVIGNPPWDRLKMQEVEWFAARAPQVAHQARAADRKTVIAKMKAAGDPLIGQYEHASSIAETAMVRARKSGDYPLLSRGDINIYSLFVERAQSLIKTNGLAGLLTPSGILSDAGSEPFMKSIIQGKRFVLGIDFFNKRNDGTLFFPDVYYRFKFCIFIASGAKRQQACGFVAFFVREANEISKMPLIKISEQTLAEINPGRFLIPIIRDDRTVDVLGAILRTRAAVPLAKEPVTYTRMLDMANDSARFLTIPQMEKMGCYPLDTSSWNCNGRPLIRLFEGKMIQAFDHRAASLSFYKTNIFRTGEGQATTDAEHADSTFVATPRFYVELGDEWKSPHSWALAIKDVTSTTNTRSTICALIPKAGAGHTCPILFDNEKQPISHLLCANLNSFVVDFASRTKIQGNHLTWHILKDLPVIRADNYSVSFGKSSARKIVEDHVLRLTYTALDMTPFARDMGYVDKAGHVKPPIIWNETERRNLRTRLDALYFILYGVTGENDIRYILSTFPIVERKDREEFDGVYLTRELILWYKRALEAGDPDTVAPESEVIRLAKSRGD